MTFLQLIASLGQDGIPANRVDDPDYQSPLSPMMLNPSLVLQAMEEAEKHDATSIESILVTKEGERRKPLTIIGFEWFRAEICGDGRAANDDSTSDHDTAMA